MEREIDYYGENDNYIHLKFGDCRKMYNFTEDFVKEYPRFADEYRKYFYGKESLFINPLEIINYTINFDIPINYYENFTDEPCTKRQAQEYLMNEYIGNRELCKSGFDDEKKWFWEDLDGHRFY